MTSLLPGALALALSSLVSAAFAQEVDFSLDDTLSVQETEIAYRLDLNLRAVAPKRIGVDLLLDLRDFQQRLPDLVDGEALFDGCGNNSALEDVAVVARGEAIAVSGTVRSRFFQCDRTSETGFQRGELQSELALVFTGEASVEVRENCFVFSLGDVDVRPMTALEDPGEESENLAAAQTLLVKAANLILADYPFCPELPLELASLDPDYETVAAREIGKGGFGIYLSGSVDASTRTILAVLRVLQSERVIPGPP